MITNIPNIFKNIKVDDNEVLTYVYRYDSINCGIHIILLNIDERTFVLIM